MFGIDLSTKNPVSFLNGYPKMMIRRVEKRRTVARFSRWANHRNPGLVNF